MKQYNHETFERCENFQSCAVVDFLAYDHYRAVESSYVKVRTAKKVNTNLATMAVYYKMHDKHKIYCVHVYVQVKQYITGYFLKY